MTLLVSSPAASTRRRQRVFEPSRGGEHSCRAAIHEWRRDAVPFTRHRSAHAARGSNVPRSFSLRGESISDRPRCESGDAPARGTRGESSDGMAPRSSSDSSTRGKRGQRRQPRAEEDSRLAHVPARRNVLQKSVGSRSPEKLRARRIHANGDSMSGGGFDEGDDLGRRASSAQALSPRKRRRIGPPRDDRGADGRLRPRDRRSARKPERPTEGRHLGSSLASIASRHRVSRAISVRARRRSRLRGRRVLARTGDGDVRSSSARATSVTTRSPPRAVRPKRANGVVKRRVPLPHARVLLGRLQGENHERGCRSTGRRVAEVGSDASRSRALHGA